MARPGWLYFTASRKLVSPGPGTPRLPHDFRGRVSLQTPTGSKHLPLLRNAKQTDMGVFLSGTDHEKTHCSLDEHNKHPRHLWQRQRGWTWLSLTDRYHCNTVERLQEVNFLRSFIVLSLELCFLNYGWENNNFKKSYLSFVHKSLFHTTNTYNFVVGDRFQCVFNFFSISFFKMKHSVKV